MTAQRPTLPLVGGCICGRLRYEVARPQIVLMCHCHNCQRRTGSAYNVSMLVLRPDFRVVSGETTSRELPGGSGALHRQHFCPDCLTRTHTEMLAHPDIINVRVGALDQPGVVQPIAQIWTSLAQPWAVVPGIQAFDENPGDIEPLADAWRSEFARRLDPCTPQEAPGGAMTAAPWQ
ncbi:MAG: GFA family protein [Pseudomonadota bacterium]